jgi:U3 small nucleolar RNA-associated protein 13
MFGWCEFVRDGSVTMTSSLSVLAHEKDINALAVAPNDKLIASASADKTIKVSSHQSLSFIVHGPRFIHCM